MTHDVSADRPATPVLDRVNLPSDLKTRLTASCASLLTICGGKRSAPFPSPAAIRAPGWGGGTSRGAVHAVFDTPRDKIIWDVGHQCYPHKILTGRARPHPHPADRRRPSGFTKRSESAYDPLGPGTARPRSARRWLCHGANWAAIRATPSR